MEQKLTISNLIKFIKDNVDTFKTLGCVDLNVVDLPIKETHTSIKPLEFQDLKKLTYLPTNLANIFDLQNNKYLHAGMSKTSVGMTFFGSILTCLKQSFLSQPISYQNKFVKRFIEILSAESKGNHYSKFEYKQYGWNRDDISNSLTNMNKNNCDDIGPNIVKYVSDYLHINIFILDVAEDILRYGGGDKYVPFKKTVFVIKYSDEGNKYVYEPLFTERSPQCFKIDDKTIKLIRDSENFQKIVPNVLHKNKKNIQSTLTEATETLEQYLLSTDVSNLRVNIKVDSKVDNKVDVKVNDKTNKTEVAVHEIKSNATLKDLQKIATELGISLDSELRAKTKATLIKEIKAYYGKN